MADRTPFGPARPLSVLIVDDYPDAANSLAMLLELGGYAVTVAQSCEEARQAAAAAPDVVLVDLGLPDGSGYELARELRASPHRAPVLVSLSGYNPDPERAAQVGIARQFIKPADPTDILDYLRTCDPDRPAVKAN
jgi:CheY-like chemotaxis protein